MLCLQAQACRVQAMSACHNAHVHMAGLGYGLVLLQGVQWQRKAALQRGVHGATELREGVRAAAQQAQG